MSAQPYSDTVNGINPAQAGYISLASTAITGLINAIGGISVSRYNNAILKSQANIARLNAQMMEENAQAVFRSTEKSIAQKTMAAGRTKSKQRAALAANGIAVAEGSAAELQASTDIIKEMDVNEMKANATRQAWGYRMKAVGYESSALMAEASKTNVGWNFASSLLGTAAQVSNQYLLMKAGGVFGDGTQKPAPIEDRAVYRF